MKDFRPDPDGVRLVLSGISHGYAGTPVLRDVSLELAAGEVTCLLGPSGCGKSTLLRIAAGVERQAGGSVIVAGRVVSDAARHLPPEGRGIGLMFQDFALFPHLTRHRQRRLRPDRPGGRSGRGGRVRCSIASASGATATSTRTSCRAASSSASRSPARWRRGRRSC